MCAWVVAWVCEMLAEEQEGVVVEDGAMPVGAGNRKCEVEKIGIGWLVGKVGLDTRHGPIEGSRGMGLGSAWCCRMGCVLKDG